MMRQLLKAMSDVIVSVDWMSKLSTQRRSGSLTECDYVKQISLPQRSAAAMSTLSVNP